VEVLCIQLQTAAAMAAKKACYTRHTWIRKTVFYSEIVTLQRKQLYISCLQKGSKISLSQAALRMLKMTLDVHTRFVMLACRPLYI
jgi:hypothetical protein